jgi:hypothetical protein
LIKKNETTIKKNLIASTNLGKTTGANSSVPPIANRAVSNYGSRLTKKNINPIIENKIKEDLKELKKNSTVKNLDNLQDAKKEIMRDSSNFSNIFKIYIQFSLQK